MIINKKYIPTKSIYHDISKNPFCLHIVFPEVLLQTPGTTTLLYYRIHRF